VGYWRKVFKFDLTVKKPRQMHFTGARLISDYRIRLARQSCVDFKCCWYRRYANAVQSTIQLRSVKMERWESKQQQRLITAQLLLTAWDQLGASDDRSGLLVDLAASHPSPRQHTVTWREFGRRKQRTRLPCTIECICAVVFLGGKGSRPAEFWLARMLAPF